MSETLKKTRDKGYIYAFTHPAAVGRVKIGWTAKDPFDKNGRVEYLTFLMRAFGLPPVEPIVSVEHDDAFQLEKRIKALLKDRKAVVSGKTTSREMFDIDPFFVERLIRSAAAHPGTRTNDEWSAWSKEWATKLTSLPAHADQKAAE